MITLITFDYADAADYGKHTSATSSTEKPAGDDVAVKQQGMKSIKLGQHEVSSQEDHHHHQQELTVISDINVINRNQCNQLHVLEPSLEMRDTLLHEGNQNTGTMPDEGSLQRNRCPHHPRARMVHFDPAGQAWGDRQDCWDCFRLMKIGEAPKYRRLTERGGKLLIEQGMEAWAA